jgi:hypothetical protein
VRQTHYAESRLSVLATAIDWARTLVWPILILLVLVGLVTRPGQQLVSWLRDRLKGVEAFGIKVELTTDAARETKDTVETAFAKLRVSLNREFELTCRRARLRDALGYVTEAALRAVQQVTGQPGPAGARATIYVDDALLHGFLYQLLDYYPSHARTSGRVISQRFGIVGRAWRSNDPQVEGHVATAVADLVEHWGMTLEEASEAGQGRVSFIAIPIRRWNTPIGVFYMDATPQDAFGNNGAAAVLRDAVTQAIILAFGEIDLPARLDAVLEEVTPRAPGIQLGTSA